MELVGAYDVPELTSFKRSLDFTPSPAKAVIKDEFKLTGSIESLVERFITRIEPKLEAGKLVIISKNGTTVSLSYDADKFDVSYTPVETPDHGGKLFTFYTVDLAVKNIEPEMAFEFVIE